MGEQGYDGWANYETWSVALIIDNDEGLYDKRRQLVAEAAAKALEDRPDYFTEAEAKRFLVADTVKEWITDASETVELNDAQPLSYLWFQLIGAALSEVHWVELADAWLEGPHGAGRMTARGNRWLELHLEDYQDDQEAIVVHLAQFHERDEGATRISAYEDYLEDLHRALHRDGGHS